MGDVTDSGNTAEGTDNVPHPNRAPDASEHVEADEAHDTSLDTSSKTGSYATSIASSLIQGHIENGRRYASLRENYWSPSDEQQWEIEDLSHFMYLLLETPRDNLLFRSPVDNPRYILDVGTGSGTWALDAAEKFPDATVFGVDVYPPPAKYITPNCHLEVEDISKDWTWNHKWDLIHMRYLLGGLSDDEWTKLYKQVYDNLEPGGWLEQLEPDATVQSDDGTLPANSPIAQWGPIFEDCADRAGRSIKMLKTMRSSIEQAGFVNVQEHLFKTPIGSWPKDKTLKEAGRVNWVHWTAGLEGYAMFLLTKFGAPQPWTVEQVNDYLAKVREQFKQPKLHIWHYSRRVWAQKPLS